MANSKHELDEKDFIHEGVAKDPYPLVYWSILILVIALASWTISNWYTRVIFNEVETSPFLQVTNREFSLFLWQNPEFMRIHVSDKASYLPAFNYIESLTMKPEMAEDYVVVPPEILFKYHTWNRLLGKEVPVQPVLRGDFIKFLDFAQEWSPTYWKDAPPDYIALIQTLAENTDSPLNVPLQVQQAYTGWKNFFYEGKAIDTFQSTYKLYNELLAKYPHYAKNYWQNLIPVYMKSKEEGELIPQYEQPSFLKSALFNFSKSL